LNVIDIVFIVSCLSIHMYDGLISVAIAKVAISREAIAVSRVGVGVVSIVSHSY